MKKLQMAFAGLLAVATCVHPVASQAQESFIYPGQEWLDNTGTHINAHGGGVIFHQGKYYWYGEMRPDKGFTTKDGVMVLSSTDLVNWHNEGVALAVSHTPGSDIEEGCIMERPKVLFCPNTQKFVMLFHLELKGRGYEAARVAFAVSDTPTGPFTFVRSLRPNAGKWPFNFKKKDVKRAEALDESQFKEWWNDDWRKAVEEGLFLARDMKGGQMSRDMTVFVDEDGTAYHVFSSEENLTLQLAQLTPDYLDYTGKYVRIAAGGQNEAPTLLHRNGQYWLITSGCTGWAPNKARMFSAPSLWGPWTQHPTPFVGKGANKSFDTQGTYILKMEGKQDGYIFMADIWNPQSLSQSRHVWLPIEFKADGTPVLRWRACWKPSSLK